MTQSEVNELIANREGRLCARLYQREDGIILTSDCVKPFQARIRRISRVAGIALSAATIGGNLVAAQTVTPPNPFALVQIQRKEIGIAVRITDASGAVIPKAKVSITNSTDKEVSSGITDNYGRWQAPGLIPGNYTVTVSSLGFEAHRETVDVVADKITEIQFTLSVGFVGEVTSLPGELIEPETSTLDSEFTQIRNRETGITVQIHDQSGNAIPKARISFKDSAGKKHSGTTDKDGNYSVSNLEPGEYKLKIHVPGSPAWEQKATVVRNEMVLVQLTKPVIITVGEVAN
jgi:hypothetical protein